MADAKATADAPKKTRKVGNKGPRKVFVLLQMLGDDGQPVPLNKDKIVLIKATRSAADALEVMDSGNFPNATYKAVEVQGR